MLENNAFSFVDCYWIENNNEKLTWNDIKVKMDDVDEFLFAKSEDKFYKGINSTLGGELEKFWFKKNNQLYLCKKVAKNFDILNAREVIASLIYEKQGYNNACHYNFITDKEDEVIGCTCKAFTNENIELITAYDLLEEYNMTQQNDVYERIIDYAVKYGCNEDDARNYMDIQTIVDYLINKLNFNVDEINLNNETSLMIAAKENNIETVKCLLNNNANVTLKNNDQKTALDFARDNGNFEIVELLENINISNSK